LKNIALTISYDGSDFAGFQRQPNQRTIQGELEAALGRLEGEIPVVYGAGRTDSGVHAVGQVVNFFSKKDLPVSAYLKGLNTLLPDDLKVKKVAFVSKDFHARKSAKAKEYHYWLRLSETPSPIGIKALWLSETLDITAMAEALKHFEGRHDFQGFRSTGSSVESSIRTVYQTGSRQIGDLVVFSITADGFLYNMVRIIMGTLLEVGRKRLSANIIPEIIQSLNRSRAGTTAPATGLYLYQVYYHQELEFLFNKNSHQSTVSNQNSIELKRNNLDIIGYFT
jgi:tRNA pseudouridine38-40 synthase